MPTKTHSPLLEITLLTAAMLGGYVWLQLPWLQPYSLQGFALALLVFFGLQFVAHARRSAHSMATIELVPLAFALVVLLGATNGAQSSYFALSYIFLLLLVLASELYTGVIVTAVLLFVLYALSIQLETSDWRQLLSLPLMLGFFLYIKYQLSISAQQKAQLENSSSALATVAQQKLLLEQFVGGFLKPKLATLVKLGQDQQTSKQVLLSQLDLLENEIDKILARPNLDQIGERPSASQLEQTSDSPPADLPATASQPDHVAESESA